MNIRPTKHFFSVQLQQEQQQANVFLQLSMILCVVQENIRIIRPGDGMEPRYYESLIGRKVSSDIAYGTPLSWNIL